MSKCECDNNHGEIDSIDIALINEKLDRILYTLEPKKASITDRKTSFDKNFDNTKDFEPYCQTCGEKIVMHNTGEKHPTKPGKFVWIAQNKDGSEHDRNGCKR